MSNNEVKFANGMIVKPRHPKCPDYVIANLSVKVEDFEQTMKANHVQGWLNIQLKVSQGGKPYAQIDEWRPQAQQYPQQQPQGGHQQFQGDYQKQQQGYDANGYRTDVSMSKQAGPSAPPPPPFPSDEPINNDAFGAGSDPLDEIPFV